MTVTTPANLRSIITGTLTYSMATTETVAKKAKKASAPKAKDPPQHPPYFEMIKDAIVTLKERTGSSPQAIAKFIEGKYKDLPANYKKLLSIQLKRNVVDGKLVKVKASFKLAPKAASSVPAKKPVSKPKVAAKPAAKKKAAVTPTKAKVAAKPKAKAPATKPKAKAVAKPKAAAAAPKVGAKRKAVAKPKTPVKAAAKSAKTSTRSTPGRAAAATKGVKKTPVKKVAAKKTATPKKAAAGAKKGKK
ncbi:hypothetical protein QVD17_22216 [Tagetes erecta]|uniref:H15 domain-containing protein n=1 Tax=Tagetes erecta TaxID=13708 RepID=A0AAD8KD72_TARER|nr:hypothetical protein QVD17_22216 [Tagetes erecta]